MNTGQIEHWTVALYREYVNDWLTISLMAEHYGDIDVNSLEDLIRIGMKRAAQS